MPAAKKTERLEARITPLQKSTFERAAAIRGISLSDFVISTVQRVASEAIQESQVLTLNGQAQRAFVDALLNPPEPNDAARTAADRYNQRVKK